MAQIELLSLKKRIFLLFLLILLGTFFLISLTLPIFYTMIFINFFLLYLLVFFLLLFLEKGNWGEARYAKTFPSLTVLVPVYNSMGTIKKCVKHIKALKYPGKLDLVFVDDGCTDGSTKYLEKVSGIKLIKMKKNSGKAVAMNFALSKIKTEMVACMDSDTYPQEDVLLKTSGYFEDKKVGAVSCLILPDKNQNFMQRIQFFEYVLGFGLSNTVLTFINAMTVVPGPMTVFRRSVFDKIGYYDTKNLTEDMEIGLRLQKFNFKICNCFEAYARTDTPDTWKKLFKQRDRWYRGRIFNVLKYNKLFFNKQNKNLGFFVLPYLFSLELISMILVLRFIIFFVEDGVRFITINGMVLASTGSLGLEIPKLIFNSTIIFFMFSYVFIFLFLFFSLRLIRYKPTKRDVFVILINILLYPMFITIVYVQSYLKEMFGVGAKWERVST
jgi:poly-beta-1,6-N-acetyl-D-glucosamine synthase